jgi:glutamate racemase
MLTKMLPKHVKIIDSGRAVAKQTQTVLTALGLLNDSGNHPIIQLFSNGDITVLNSILDCNFEGSYLDF